MVQIQKPVSAESEFLVTDSDNIRSGGVPTRGYADFGGVVDEVSSRSVPHWDRDATAPDRAPNVVLMLVDDMGFSDISPFGSEIDTPAVQELSQTGYSFTNYHTSSVCSPARASLLTGLNPHRAGFGSVAHSDPGYPGYRFEIADEVPTIAESFRAGGYATFMVGKWHLTIESKMHDGADKSSWPVQRGFDHYYGSMDGFTSLHHPHRLVRDNTSITVDDFGPDYYLTDDLTDNALTMIKGLRSGEADKPFFLYFAHQAVHGPLQAKSDDIEKYRGMYEAGWDHIRNERFARQVELGLFPDGTRAAPRNTEPGLDVTPWDALTAEQQERFARYMAVYAAAVDNVDQNVQRLVSFLKQIGEYDNTIIAFTSDNGATGEGGADGTRSYFSQFTAGLDLPADLDRDVDRDLESIGGPQSFVHYPRGWAWASNTPFRLYKGHTFNGGIRAPLVLSWPRGLPRPDGDAGVRQQYAYVSDLGHTLLSLAGVERLQQRHGMEAPKPDSIPFDRVLRDQAADACRRQQYSEFIGNRALYANGWKIVTSHRPGEQFSDAEFQVYHVASDPAETVDLSQEYPQLRREMADIWHREAWQNTVFPLDDDGSTMRKRPETEARFEQPVTLWPGTPTLERFRSHKLISLRSFTVTCHLDFTPNDAGVLFSHGDQGGGYVVWVEDDRIQLSYNEYGRMYRAGMAEGDSLNDGRHLIEVRFEALADFRWRITVTLDGHDVAGLPRVSQLVGMAPFTGISAGIDRGGPVDWDLHSRHGSFGYTGDLSWVRYVPEDKAEYNHEQLVAIERAVERRYE